MKMPALAAGLAVLVLCLSLSAAPRISGLDKDQGHTQPLQSKSQSRPSISLYMEANFKGRLTRIKAPAEFPGSAALKEIGIKNDSLQSLKVPAGVKVMVFDADNYSGDSATFDEGEHASLGKLSGRVSSMKAENTAAGEEKR